MSGTDPDGKRQKPIDSTRAWSPGAEPTPPPALPANAPKIPGITLQYEIARGGMGVVYSGRQDFLDRRVAVKLLSVELGGDSFVQRFQREAKILAGIKHPNIVACHLAGTTDDGQSYLVMEFIDGPSLKKWITDHGAISVAASLRLTRATAQALGHACSLGIIHRDVKAENILLETVTSTALDVAFPFTPKVVDLGLARASDGNASMGLTSPGSVMGTPATMSPEQYDEPDSVDFLTDIYGLGCVLYEMLVGKPAFRARKLSEILAQKRAPQAPDPCQDNPSVPLAVGTLVQSMLAVSREDRPASYKELDERLAELIDVTGSRTRSMVKPQAGPVVGHETVHGAGPVMRSTKVPTQPPPQPSMDATIASKPTGGPRPAASKPPGKPFTPKNDATGPGLLRTSELNFLAEGLEDGAAANAAPAFHETPDAEATPSAHKTSVISPAALASREVAAPVASPKSKAGMVIAAVAVVGVGIGGFAMLGGGDKPTDPNKTGPVVQIDPPKTDGSNPSQPVEAKPPAPNQAPVIASIDGEAEHAIGRDFVLEAKVSDGDGDKLTCAWTMPDEIIVRKGLDQPKATFRIEDGLPGVEFEIGVDIGDGKTTTHGARKVRVGEMPTKSPLVGFLDKSEFKVDARRSWNDGRGFISGRGIFTTRTVQTSLGSDSYWEWAGSLVSEIDSEKQANGDERETAPAMVGLRFEFGKRAWQVSCSRVSGADDADWTIWMMEGTFDGVWKFAPVAGSQPWQWKQPSDEVGDTRGYFCVQRRRNELVIEIGDAMVPRESQRGEDGKEVEQPSVRSKITVPIPEFSGEPQLTLFVDQGRGEFRLRQR